MFMQLVCQCDENGVSKIVPIFALQLFDFYKNISGLPSEDLSPMSAVETVSFPSDNTTWALKTYRQCRRLRQYQSSMIPTRSFSEDLSPMSAVETISSQIFLVYFSEDLSPMSAVETLYHQPLKSQSSLWRPIANVGGWDNHCQTPSPSQVLWRPIANVGGWDFLLSFFRLLQKSLKTYRQCRRLRLY